MIVCPLRAYQKLSACRTTDNPRLGRSNGSVRPCVVSILHGSSWAGSLGSAKHTRIKEIYHLCRQASESDNSSPVTLASTEPFPRTTKFVSCRTHSHICSCVCTRTFVLPNLVFSLLLKMQIRRRLPGQDTGAAGQHSCTCLAVKLNGCTALRHERSPHDMGSECHLCNLRWAYDKVVLFFFVPSH